MSSLGRADIWPVGDVALQAAIARALKLRKRPNEKAMEKLARSLAPMAHHRRAPVLDSRRSVAPRKTRSRGARESRRKRKRENRNGVASAFRSPLAARARRGHASCRAVSWLWRGWQRSHRACAALAELAADGCFRRAQRARTLRRLADGLSMVSDLAPRSGGNAEGRRRCRRHAQRISRQRTCASRIAARTSGAGGLQPGHDDVAACGPQPRGEAGRDRRLFRHARRRRNRKRRLAPMRRRSCSSMAMPIP